MALLVFISCQKQVQQDLISAEKQTIAKQTIEEQYTYVRDNLRIVMKELAPFMKNKDFIHLIHSEAAKKFDGSNAVLIKTLIENPKFSNLINTDKIKVALEAFINIDGQNLYPQIYIPYFEKHFTKRNSPLFRTSVITDEFVIYEGMEPQTTAPSYTYNEEGIIIPTGTIVNEQYALNNEIYVISINEVVENDATVPIYSVVTQHASTVNFKIEKIWVKDNKESWLAGASEVHIKALAETYNHRIDGNPLGGLTDYQTTRSVTPSNYKGHGIIQMIRDEITSSGIPYLINYPLNENWKVDNFYTDPIAYTYVIFEYDPWPAGTKTAASEIVSCLSCPNEGGRFSYLSFRSSNSPYGGNSTDSYINYAIYGNVSGLPSNFQNLYYDGYYFISSTLDFTTKKY